MKYVLIIALGLLIATLVFVFGWFGSGKNIVVVPPVIETKIVYEAMGEEQIVEEERYAEVQAEYKKLEKARRDLDRRLARLKAIMWNITLPAERVGAIVSKMRKGHALLKTKKLLGAFNGVESIRDELTRVEYAHQNLEGIAEEIKGDTEQHQHSSEKP